MPIEGIRHLIECHCVLPQFRNRTPPLYHKFIAFSLVDDDKVQQKLTQCNNCGIIHKVVDLCKSEIVHGLEEGRSLRTIEDIKMGLPARLVEFLTQQNIDISTWEYVEFILDNKIEKEVVINKDEKADIVQLKILHIKEDGTFKVRSETRQDEIGVE
jgi:hypothetical protein